MSEGKSLNSGWDIRIVYWNGGGWTELDRLRDDLYPWDQTDTRVWFQTQAAISAGGSDNDYYMYYDNSSAGSPPMNWENVFLFYDNFNDDSFDTGRWTCGGSGASCTESGQSLTLGANTWLFANASYAFGQDTRWEARIQLSHDNASYYNYWGASDSVGYSGDYTIFWMDGSQNIAEQNFISRNIWPSTPTSYHTYIIDREGGDGIRYFQDTTELEWITSGVTADDLRVFVWVDAASRTETLDYVRVREYVTSEPTAGLGIEEDNSGDCP